MCLSRQLPLKVISYIAVLQPPNSRNYRDLGCSPFDRHYSGNHYCFLLLRILRCFSSPGLLPSYDGWYRFTVSGYPIRIPTDHRLFAPPRRFSQLITSFIASESQGIHRMPLLTFFTYDFLDVINIFSQYVKEPSSAVALAEADYSDSTKVIFWTSPPSLKLQRTQWSLWTRTIL